MSDGDFAALYWAIVMIGVWGGYSLARIADALKRIVSEIDRRR